MTGAARNRRVLLAGGGGGLLGRALLEQLAPTWEVRSLHRRAVPREAELGVEWVRADIGATGSFERLVENVDAVVNVAWYRSGTARRFRPLFEGLLRLLEAARSRGLPFVQVSVPPAPSALETGIPYLVYKRRFDEAVRASGVPYAIVRPAMLFGPGDVLLGVMLRSIWRYPFFPMFGDGTYRIAPIAARDVANRISHELETPGSTTIDCGGPAVYAYRDVTDRMFALLGKRPRYWTMSPSGGARLARVFETFGSTKLYAYEVDWLVSDRLAVPPAPGADGPLERVEPYLRAEAERLTGRPVPDLGPIAARG